MSLSGSLQVTEVSQLVNWARQGSHTGALHFEKEGVHKKLFFEAGRVVGSASSVPQEWLGHFLVGRGLITEVELAKAVELQEESGMLIGSILVTIGGISESQLNELLVQHCTEILCDLLTWTDGTFEFHEGEIPRGFVPADIDIAKALLEGVKRMDQWRRIRQVIPSLEMVPIALGDLEAPPDDPVAAQVLSRVDDDRSVEEILLESHATEYAGCRTLTRAIEDGKIKLITPRAPRDVPQSTGPGEKESARATPAPTSTEKTPARRISADDLLACSSDAARSGEIDLARRYLEAARALARDDESTLRKVARISDALGGAPERKVGVTPTAAPAEPSTDDTESGSARQTPATVARPAYRSIPRPAPSTASEPRDAPKASPSPTPSATAAKDSAPKNGPELDRSSVPSLSCAPEEIINLDLTPEEGFLLTRMDGRTTLGELIQISPMPAEQAERALGRLVAAGHVDLAEG